MSDLLDDPRKEHKRRSDLDGVESDLVEEPVRIETAALHTISFPAQGFVRLLGHAFRVFSAQPEGALHSAI